MITYNS